MAEDAGRPAGGRRRAGDGAARPGRRRRPHRGRRCRSSPRPPRLARELAAGSRAETRALHEIASVDDPEIGERWYSPVYGPGNPVAPPMVATDTPDGRATGRVTLGKPHEGPPGLVHGGVVATLLDHVLARAIRAAGRGGLTATLTVTYRRPVPLGVPLLATAEMGDDGGTADDGARPARRRGRPRDDARRGRGAVRGAAPRAGGRRLRADRPRRHGLDQQDRLNPVPEPAVPTNVRLPHLGRSDSGSGAADGSAYGPQVDVAPEAAGTPASGAGRRRPVGPARTAGGDRRRAGRRRPRLSRILADHLGTARPRRGRGDLAGHSTTSTRRRASTPGWPTPGRSFELVGVVSEHGQPVELAELLSDQYGGQPFGPRPGKAANRQSGLRAGRRRCARACAAGSIS